MLSLNAILLLPPLLPVHLETKDWIALIASLSVFGFSVSGFFQKKAESRQAQRKQLTDVLKEISRLNLDDAQYSSITEDERRAKYPHNYIGLLNDQRRFFVRQAALLADGLGKDASTFERGMIATTFDNMDYVDEAQRFFESAIARGQNELDKGIALRNYARFLYRQGLEKEGDAQFSKSIVAFSGNEDRLKYYRGDTYRRWAETSYYETRLRERAIQLLKTATEEFSSMKSESRKNRELRRLKMREAEMFTGTGIPENVVLKAQLKDSAAEGNV